MALPAVLAFALLGCVLPQAASASETPVEWRQGGAALSVPVTVKSKGTLKLTDEKATGGAISVECEAAGEGSVGTGTFDEQTKSTLSKCAFVKSGSCETAGEVSLVAVNLLWDSELANVEGTPRDTISTGGKGTPGYKIECRISGIKKVVDECTGTLATLMANAVGGVNATFDGEKLTCTSGGAGAGALEGTQLIEAMKGSALDVFPAPEWRQGGAALSEPVAVKSKGTLKLTDERVSGHVISVECEAAGEGSAGVGPLDEQTKSTLSKCTLVKEGECEAAGGVSMTAVNLPWRSELADVGGTPGDVISTSGKGTLGYKIECRVSGIKKVVDECTGTLLSTLMTNVTGGVDATFDGPLLKCTKGGTNAGALEGTQLIEATKGSALEVFPAPEWHQGGTVLSEPLAVKSKGTFKLTDENASGGALSVECEETGEGSVGVGALGDQTKSTFSKCAVLESAVCEPAGEVSVTAVNLSWSSELVAAAGTVRDVFGSGKGMPGYKIECRISGIKKTIDECTATSTTQLRTLMTNVTGGVDATFDSEKLRCTNGGNFVGKLEGAQLIEATKGGTLEVTLL
jgi:hypothetical protein